MHKYAIRVALVVLIVISFRPASAATLNVSGAAGCSNTTGTPFCTINAAILAAASGDTIQIAAGTYATTIANFSKPLHFVGAGSSSSGTVITKPVVYTGAGPLSMSNLRIQGGGSNLKISGTGPFSGLTVSDAAFVGNGGGAHGIFIKQNGPVSDITATNCIFTNHGQSGFLIQVGTGTNTAIDGVTISGSTFDGNGEYGVRIDPRTTDLEVASSSITNNAIDGIVLLNTDGATLQDLTITGNRNGILLIPLNSAQSVSNIQLIDVNVNSNTRFISGQYGSGMTLTGDFGAVSNVTATNSTFSANTLHGVATSGQVSGVSIGCSVIAGNGQHGISNGSSARVMAEQVYWGCAGGPAASGCSTVSGDVDSTPFRATSQDSCSGGEELPPDPATVAPPIDPTRISNVHDTTMFLYTGTNPIQRAVAPGTIERLRAAVLRGLVSTRDGAPLPGVRVTIVGHPEYGHTLTRADGRYDLSVNGGGPVTIHLEKGGYIPVDRIEEVPWNRFVVAEDVVMLQYDPVVSTVTLGSAQAQVARGSVVTDADGGRQATLIFQPNTTATMTLASGGTQPLNVANVRATEFSVGPDGPKAMPAPLPPQSGYTYCVELSADEGIAAGATRIDFDKPVAFYVENFLGFPAGGAVPTGYYDRNCNKWVAAPNGRIVTIVGIVENRAYLDIDGDAQADDSDALLGTTVAEREQLAMLYVAGTSLWRVPIPHFTPWDHNWPYGPPSDAGPPPGDVPPLSETPALCSTQESGSVIECEAQNLGEVVPITGTPLTLSYNSSRVAGRLTSRLVRITATGDTVPASLRRVKVTIDVAGSRDVLTLEPEPGQTLDFLWDQKDPFGRDWQGAAPMNVTVGYVYNAVYQEAATFGNAFGKFGNQILVDGDRATGEITAERKWSLEAPVGGWLSEGAGFGGWTLAGHHVYDSSANTLELGDGIRRRAQAGSWIIRSLAADGGSGARAVSSQSTGEVTPTSIPEHPQCITADAEGNLYVGGDFRVYRIAPDGTSTVIAGDGTGTFNGDGIPATSAGIDPTGLAIGPDGAVYIAEETNRRVRRVVGGVIATVAGNGDAGYSGDGDVSATGSPLTPHGVAVAPDGTLYVADRTHNVVRSVDLCSNEMWSIAGSGQDISSLRAAIQTNAGETIEGPASVSTTSDGTLYMVGKGNAIYRMRPDGGVEQVIAEEEEDCSNEYMCVPAKQGSVLAHGGVLYYTSPAQHMVKAIIGEQSRVIAGTGQFGYGGDEGFAQAALLNSPTGLYMNGDGALYVTDSGNGVIRVLKQPFPGLTNGEVVVVAPDASSYDVFDEKGRHLRTVDALFGTTKLAFGYDAEGYVTSLTDVDGNTTEIERSGPQATAIVAPGGQRTELAYDGHGYLHSVTNPAGESHRFTYGTDGLLRSMTDPRSHTYSFDYDDEGRLLRDRDPAGGSKTLVRTGEVRNFNVTLTTAEGRTATHAAETSGDAETRRRTDSAGRTTTIVRSVSGEATAELPDGTFTRTAQMADPRFGIQAPLVSATTEHAGGFSTSTATSRSYVLSTDPSQPVQSAFFSATFNGRAFTSFFEGATRTFTTTSPAGRTVTYRYDARGHLIEFVVPGLAPVIMTYDSRGLLMEIAQGSRSITMTYDAQLRLATVTDPLDDVMSFDYDNADRLTEQTLPGGRTVSLVPDANGNVTSVTPPGRPPHLFSFDAVDMPISYTPPGGSTASATFDLDHRATVVSRGDGRSVAITYDAEDRVASITINRGEYAFTWDPVTGQLASVTAPDGGALTFNYRGSLLESASWSGGEVNGTVTWAYDDDQRLASETVSCPTASGPSCDTIDYDYDSDNLLTQAGDLFLQRDSSNGLLTGTAIDLMSDAYDYSEYGEMERYQAFFVDQPVFSQQLTRDAAGRIITNIETIDGVATTYEYGYDSARRLSSVRRNGTQIAGYGYDANGNRLTRTTPSGVVTGTYDSEDRVQTYSDTTYTHTAAGDLQAVSDAAGTRTYTYDELGNLMSVGLPNGDVIEYVIDGLNRRIAKKRNGAVAQRWLYRNALQIAAELDTNGEVSKRFTYATRTNVPDAMVTPTGTYQIVSDHLGSVRVVVDVATGAIAQRMDYDEFGDVLSDTNPGFQPFGFAGGLYDADTGLVRFGARDYDPHTGRWTTKEPLRFGGGDPNLYLYVGSDPVNWVDPSGLVKISDMDCLDLTNEINRLTSEVAQRAGEEMNWQRDLLSGTKSRPNIINMLKYAKHKAEFEAKQRRINKLLKEFDRRPCKPDLATWRREWASAEFPDDDYIGQLWRQSMWDLLIEGPPKPEGPVLIPGVGPAPVFVPR